ncbi:MAG: FCD domain-containing protein, partial [Synergistaceae bacterium]|nr:FCD domain-containing protein [Synergistaceae bacterium]
MACAKNEVDCFILSCLTDSGSPVGAGFLLEKAKQEGIHISEATIGRALRAWRSKGLLERIGNQGHRITEPGKDILGKLQKENRLASVFKTFMSEFSGETGFDNLAGVLTARKALEREAVIQAALNATDDELNEIGNIVAMQYEMMRTGEDYAEVSSSFHRSIFRISHVPFLETVYNFIGRSTSWQRVFVGMFTMFGTPANVDHEKILDAMKDRNPTLAAELMTSHIDSVMRNAKK